MNSGMTIGEIAEDLNLSVDTLRFYEKTGVTAKISRDSSGRRIYFEDDKKWLGFVNCLKSTGMPLDKIRLYQKLLEYGNETAMERREILIEHQQELNTKILELNVALDRINHKVEFYDELMKDQGL